MVYLIKFLDNNGKLAVYTGGNIHWIDRYIYIIGASTTLTTSGQQSHDFSPSSYTNNYTKNLQPVIEALHMRQNIIFECCGGIGLKTDA